MNVSLNWLNDHIDLSGYTLPQLSDLLTFAGVEVEEIEHKGLDSDLIVVAQVQSSDKHPDADKLSVCQVDDGSGTPRQIVCGAKNYKVGDKVPLALPGTVMPGDFKIKKGKLRGIESLGMMCSGRELGISQDHDGLLILPEDAPIGKPIRELFKPDTIVEVEVTPNRSDWLSHLGMARELAALANRPLKGTSDYCDSTTPTRIAKPGEVKIEAPESCPFYTARFIRGVKVGPSPAWLKEKLEAIGLRPINNIVDITNYVLMEMGQPLHAFDVAKLNGGITVRSANEGEKFLALDGETYDLLGSDLVIADSANAVAIGGVMGGENSGVTEFSTDILLESAYFDPPAIRRTSRRLGLSSDSSYRFERGIDPLQTLGASALATKLILEIAGGEADEMTLECGEAPVRTGEVTLDIPRAQRLLGAEIAESEIDRILTGLGLEKTAGTADISSTWRIPSYRLDLQRHVDLVEEIARVYGLDNIPASQGAIFSEASDADHTYDFTLQLKDRLTSLGFYEAGTIKLIADGQLADVVGCTPELPVPYPLKNPLSDDHTIMRSSIVPALLNVAERNVRMGANALRFFECGTVFRKSDDGSPIESQAIALLMNGPSQPASWHGMDQPSSDFFHLRGVIESIIPRGLTLTPSEHPTLMLAAKVLANGAHIGWAGQLPPARARAIGTNAPLLVAELEMALLQTHNVDRSVQFAELPKFPGSSRDIAMFVPADLPNGKLEDFFNGLNEPLLESFSVFDVFISDTPSTDASQRKSIAYSLTYRDESRTLQATEIDEAHGRVLDLLKQSLPVEIR
ncbi:MAG: phenylalanyl-tRNA synthetase beta chain [Verrucomicrobiales bacterium]|jgi:phenylalanyl-tRNA synthetase beta chain